MLHTVSKYMLCRVTLLSLLLSKTFPKQILHNPATTKKVMIGISRKSSFDKYGTESVKILLANFEFI